MVGANSRYNRARSVHIMSIAIRLLDERDIPRAMELVVAAGWNQTTEDWRRLIRFQRDGCFAAWMPDDQEPEAVEIGVTKPGEGLTGSEKILGTVTTTAYGMNLAWIGMMLVDPGHRRLGIGLALMQRAMSYLIARKITAIKLDATPVGRPLYEKLGFREEFAFRRWRREDKCLVDSPSASKPHVVQDESFDASFGQLAEMDRLAFGADRTSWLRELSATSSCIYRMDGYGMLRRGRIASYLGPIVSRDLEVAQSIIEVLLAEASGDVFWDVPGTPASSKTLERLAVQLGFEPVRDLTRMYFAPDPNFRLPSSADLTGQFPMQFGLGDPATG